MNNAVVGKTVLVVDASETSRIFLASHLHEKHYHALEVSSGKEALIFAWRDSPQLILFDPVLRDIKAEEFVQKLKNDTRTRNTPIIALSSDPDPVLRESCLKAGVTEYLFKSAEAVPALDNVLNRLLSDESPHSTPMPVVAEESKEKGLLIVFLSAKGGTGTSSLCTNLAMNIKTHLPESQVVVADLVLPIGSIGQIVGYQGELDLATVAALSPAQTNGEYFHKNLPEPELWKFQLLSGSPDPQHGNVIKGERIEQIVDVLRSVYDFVILDIGRSLSRISLPLIQQADLIALIVSTDQSTVKLTKTVWEYLHTQGVRAENIFAILNRAVGLEGLTKSEAEQVIGIPIQTTMPYMGGNFTLANNLNQPIITKYPTDTASIIFKQTADDMVKLAVRLHAKSLA